MTTEHDHPRVLEGPMPTLPAPGKHGKFLLKAPMVQPQADPLPQCTVRAQIVHTLRQFSPGATVDVNTIENNLHPESKLWNHEDPTQRRQAIRDNLTRLTSPRPGSANRGISIQQPVSWDPALYARGSRYGEVTERKDAGGNRGREPFPRCLTRVARGRYEILPEVYEPQTELERVFGVPDTAGDDAPWPRLSDEQLSRLRRAFPTLNRWPRPELARLVHIATTLDEPEEDDP